MLEAQEEFSKNNNSYAEKQLKKNKKRLLKEDKLSEQEIINICEIQTELAKLELEDKFEAKMEVPPNPSK